MQYRLLQHELDPSFQPRRVNSKEIVAEHIAVLQSELKCNLGCPTIR